MDLVAQLLRRPITYDSWSAAGLNLILALWLIMSPWVLGYADTKAFWVPIATGGLVVVSAGLRLGTRLQGRAFHLADIAIAAWLLAAALWIADGAKPVWNDVISACVLVLLALVGLVAQSDAAGDA